MKSMSALQETLLLLLLIVTQIPISQNQNHSFFVIKASSDFESEASKEEGEEEPYEEYEVEIDHPCIDATASGGSADKARVFNVGDKVLATRLDSFPFM
ncbi:hypothetical protein RYX36_034329 [Vicia faba]